MGDQTPQISITKSDLDPYSDFAKDPVMGLLVSVPALGADLT